MSSNLPSRWRSRALQTFKKCGRVVKIQGSGLCAVEMLLDYNFAALRAFLDAFLGSNWSSWTPLGSNLKPLGRLLDPSWAQLGALGRLLGSTWSLLGASWPQLGASWVPLGPNLTLLDGSWALLEASWAPLGHISEASWAKLGALGQPLGSTWRPNALPSTIQAQGRTWTVRLRFLLRTVI